MAYILTLGTLPEYRRLGLGKLLLRKCVLLALWKCKEGALLLLSHTLTTHGPFQCTTPTRARDAIDSPRCGAVYLHVITYNEAAIQFYSANGFKRLRTLPGQHRMLRAVAMCMRACIITALTHMLFPSPQQPTTRSRSSATTRTS